MDRKHYSGQHERKWELAKNSRGRQKFPLSSDFADRLASVTFDPQTFFCCFSFWTSALLSAAIPKEVSAAKTVGASRSCTVAILTLINRMKSSHFVDKELIYRILIYYLYSYAYYDILASVCSCTTII